MQCICTHTRYLSWRFHIRLYGSLSFQFIIPHLSPDDTGVAGGVLQMDGFQRDFGLLGRSRAEVTSITCSYFLPAYPIHSYLKKFISLCCFCSTRWLFFWRATWCTLERMDRSSKILTCLLIVSPSRKCYSTPRIGCISSVSHWCSRYWRPGNRDTSC